MQLNIGYRENSFSVAFQNMWKQPSKAETIIRGQNYIYIFFSSQNILLKLPCALYIYEATALLLKTPDSFIVAPAYLWKVQASL